VNPPYDNVKNWLLRAIALSLSSQSSSLFLLPTRIEARYFSEIITYFPVLLLDRPITFVGYKRPAHWASMLVLITPQDSENFQNEKTSAERIFSAHFTSIESFLSSFWTPHRHSICSVIQTANVEDIDLIMEDLKVISSTIVPPRNFILVDGLLKDPSDNRGQSSWYRYGCRANRNSGRWPYKWLGSQDGCDRGLHAKSCSGGRLKERRFDQYAPG